MTQSEWLTNCDPQSMIAFCEQGTSYRKLQLFACACCRRIWHLIASEKARRVVEIAERIADGEADNDEALRASGLLSFEQITQQYSRERGGNVANFASEAAGRTISNVRVANERAIAARCEQALIDSGLSGTPADTELTDAQEAIVAATIDSEELAQARLLRDVTNPFYSAAFDSRWRTSDVIGLARAIYDERAFERMPILADALMDSGCEDEQIIAHCRGEGEHIRGCWVVDHILRPTG